MKAILLALLAVLPVTGCVGRTDLTVTAQGVAIDTVARVYQEVPCEGKPMRWSVQLTNDHSIVTSDGKVNEMKYGVVLNETLISFLRNAGNTKERLELSWVRYKAVGCEFTDQEVVFDARRAA